MIDIKITAVESRREMAEALKAKLNLSDADVIYDDRPDGGNAMYTVKKAWRQPIPAGVTHRVVLNEDLQVCDGFQDIVAQMVAAHPDVCFSLFSTYLNGKKLSTSTPYIDHGRQIFGCAIVLPIGLIEECFAWIEENCPAEIWDNDGITRWIRHKDLQVLTTCPMLVQHIGDQSVVDPNFPVRRTERFEEHPTADWASKEIQPLPEFDWFKPIDFSDPKRPLMASEVAEMFVRQNIQTLEVDKPTALRMVAFYPAFSDLIGQSVEKGFKFSHEGKLYETAQALTFQAHYPPDTDGMEALYDVIDDSHSGTLSDPIPYEGNMKLIEGKHYVQDGITYQCTRDSGIALSHPLSALVGLYVIAVEA